MKMKILFVLIVYCSSWCANVNSDLYKCESMDSLFNGIPSDTDCIEYIRNETILQEYIEGNVSRMTDLGCELDSPTVNLTECGQINGSVHHLRDALKNTTYYKNRSCVCTNGECTECGPVLCTGPGGDYLTYSDAQICMKKCKAFNCSLIENNPTPMIPSTEYTTTVANTPSVQSPTTDIHAVKPPADNTPSKGLWGLIAVPILICGATVFIMWWCHCCCFRDQTPRPPTESSGGGTPSVEPSHSPQSPTGSEESLQSSDLLMEPLSKGVGTTSTGLQGTEDEQDQADPQDPPIQEHKV